MSADFWAGYISGAAGLVIGNPLDLIKVRLQAQSSAKPTLPLPQASPNSPAAAAAAAAASTQRVRIHNLRDALRGLPAPVLTYGALNALLFTTYNRSLFLLASPHAANHPSGGGLWAYDVAATTATYPYWAHFTAGALAGLATFIISAPTELVKCRAQVLTDAASSNPGARTTPLQSSSWQIAKATLRTQGIRGLYHGGVVTSLRDSLGYGAYFWTYEATKDLWTALRPPPPAAPSAATAGTPVALTADEAAKILLCGGLAGIATWVSIFPLDVIKTRVQTQPLALPPALHRAAAAGERSPLVPPVPPPPPPPPDAGPQKLPRGARPAGAWALARQAYRAEGVAVFFRGLMVCCVRAFIVNAVQWAVYEWMMRELR